MSPPGPVMLKMSSIVKLPSRIFSSKVNSTRSIDVLIPPLGFDAITYGPNGVRNDRHRSGELINRRLSCDTVTVLIHGVVGHVQDVRSDRPACIAPTRLVRQT